MGDFSVFLRVQTLFMLNFLQSFMFWSMLENRESWGENVDNFSIFLRVQTLFMLNFVRSFMVWNMLGERTFKYFSWRVILLYRVMIFWMNKCLLRVRWCQCLQFCKHMQFKVFSTFHEGNHCVK